MALPKGWKQVDGTIPIESGQAHVFKVERERDDQLYALKRLKNPSRAERFEREVATMQKLHAADLPVPEIIEVDEIDGKPYFVMPWFEEGSLEERLEAGGIADDLEGGLSLLIELAQLLAKVHEAEIAHRDLKPANVLLGESTPFLTDFGLSLSAAEEDPEARLTTAREPIGSRLYIAPENENGFNEEVDQRPADFYAFGKVGWALLSGQQPPAREEQSAIENRLANLHADPDLEPLDALFSDLIRPDPRARLVDWSVVLAELEGVRAQLRGEAGSESRDEVVAEAIEAARRWRASQPAVDAAKREEEAAQEVTGRHEMRQALLQGAHARDEELSEISNAAPMLRIEAADGYGLSTAPSPGDLKLEGLDLPDDLDLSANDLRESVVQGAAAAIRISHEAAGSRVGVQLGLHPAFQGKSVWVLRCPLLVTDPHAIHQLSSRNDTYSEWSGPFQVGLETTLARAEELGRRLIEPGIRLFGECAEHLAAGRHIDDVSTWVGDQGPGSETSAVAEEIRKQLSTELSAEEAQEALKDAGTEAVRRLQTLTAPLNERLKQAHPGAEIDLLPDRLSENLMRTLDGGPEIIFDWGRRSQIGSGPDYHRYTLRFGRGLEVCEDGHVILHAFIDVGTPDVSGSDFYWQATPRTAPLDGGEIEELLIEFIEECDQKLNEALAVFAAKLAEREG